MNDPNSPLTPSQALSAPNDGALNDGNAEGPERPQIELSRLEVPPGFRPSNRFVEAAYELPATHLVAGLNNLGSVQVVAENDRSRRVVFCPCCQERVRTLYVVPSVQPRHARAVKAVREDGTLRIACRACHRLRYPSTMKSGQAYSRMAAKTGMNEATFRKMAGRFLVTESEDGTVTFTAPVRAPWEK